ncbi:hypothetical protein ACOI1C_08355 [Bacillus sp. DJP31]|uniref:hypothetical protein n=1 Tax=Bacillus sp. DJP31 TaxID=3409789 RepID=UPI003BB5A4A2
MNPFFQTLNRIHESNKLAEIIYLSASGDLSHRAVIVKKVTPYYFQGYCLLRKTNRTFSLQNILSVYPKNSKRSSAL